MLVESGNVSCRELVTRMPRCSKTCVRTLFNLKLSDGRGKKIFFDWYLLTYLLSTFSNFLALKYLATTNPTELTAHVDDFHLAREYEMWSINYEYTRTCSTLIWYSCTKKNKNYIILHNCRRLVLCYAN